MLTQADILKAFDQKSAEIRARELERARRGSSPEDHAEAIVDAIELATHPLLIRIQALEGEVRELRAAPPGVHYEGIYEQAKRYQQGSLVTKGGSLWLALMTVTNVTPGASSPGQWKLVCKRGEARSG